MSAQMEVGVELRRQHEAHQARQNRMAVSAYRRTPRTPVVKRVVLPFDLLLALVNPARPDVAEAPKRIKIADIQWHVGRYFDVSVRDLKSERRTRSIVWPRMVSVFLCHELTDRSLAEIGRQFGNRDHTTIHHSIHRVQDRLDGFDETLFRDIETIK